jgi:hypothetical protein
MRFKWANNISISFRSRRHGGPLPTLAPYMASWPGGQQKAGKSTGRVELCALQRLKVSDREDPFASVIRCTADPAKADKRTRSKWSRVMRYAAVYKPDSEPLGDFIKRKGGINECAARFTRWMGRGTRDSRL